MRRARRATARGAVVAVVAAVLVSARFTAASSGAAEPGAVDTSAGRTGGERATSARGAAAANGPFLYNDSLRTADGTVVATLPFKLTSLGGIARFSPDGTKLVEVKVQCGTPCSSGDPSSYSSQLLLRDQVGQQTVLTDIAGIVRALDWSPAGDKIAVYGGTSVANWIKVVTLPTGATDTVISALAGSDDFRVNGGVSWHPTDGRLAFIGTELPEDDDVVAPGQVYTIPSTGGDRTLYNDPYLRFCDGPSCRYLVYSSPAWSPDGSRILVGVRDDGAGPDFLGTIAQGQRDPVPVRMQAPSSSGPAPTWSPDGTRILVGTDGGKAVTLGASGGGEQVLSGVHVYDWQPCPGGVCPSWGSTANRVPSTITLNYRSSLRAVRTNGQVVPARPGGTVTITLAKRKGKGWKNVASKSGSLSAMSRYVIKLPQQDVFDCRATATYAGDSTTMPATAVKYFSC